MVQSTYIARITDGLPLMGTQDDDPADTELQNLLQQQKLIVRKLSPQSEPQCVIESGKYVLFYLIRSSIVYVTISPRGYPRKLAFAYLSELSTEFERSHSPNGEALQERGLRPYMYQKFDAFVGKTSRVYSDGRAAESSGGGVGGAGSGLEKLNNDLQDVTRIMTKNMEDLLWRGDSLDRMSTLSSSLRDESLKYRKAARQINIDALIRKWAPVGVLGFFFAIVLWWRFG